MTFRQGVILWLLILVPIAGALWAFRTVLRDRATARFGNTKVVRFSIRGSGGRLRTTRALVFLSALALLIVALAGPQYGSRTRWLRKRGVDLVIALDFSKSMLARDVAPSRIGRAKAELIEFLDSLDGDRVGIVSFAGDTMEFPMTVDYASLALYLRDMSPMDMPIGGTAIGRALTASKSLLERSLPHDITEEERAERALVVVLFTDGEDHEGDPVAAARELAAAGIQVYTVGIGSRSGEPIPTYTPDGAWTGYQRDSEGNVVTTSFSAEAEARLREVAEITGGRFVRAEEGGVGVREIAQHLSALHQSEQRARQITVHEDRFALVLIIVFFLLILERIVPEAWIHRRITQDGARSTSKENS